MSMQSRSPSASAAQSPGALVSDSIVIIREALARFPPEQIGVSFNGGKDSEAMLQLIFDALGDAAARKLTYFVFESSDEFPQLREFREAEMRRRECTIRHIDSDMKNGLWELHRDHGVNAAFLGVRSTDPSGRWIRQPMTRCTEGWPPVTLVCPLLAWEYADVWAFTLRLGLPMCELYRQGYTSIGSRHTTVPNPALRDDATGVFSEAWLLVDGTLERSNRVPGSRQ